MYKRVKEQIHFVGIGGIGMSGIAEILARLGFPVSGSDLTESDIVKKLRDLGVRIEIGHRAENIAGAKAIVVSSAVSKDNPEVVEARKLQLPIVPRAEMLAELMRLKYGVAVAGTHGKTTTTSMLGSILTHANFDPTVIVGGKVDALGGNAKLGKGQFLVAEADESDGSFLRLSPVVTLVTNIDNDHLDHYGGMTKLRSAFVEFANRVPYYGRTILCIDDEEAKALLKQIDKPVWTYGFSSAADFQIRDFEPCGATGSRFEVWRSRQKLAEVNLVVPGQHNARNAVGAFAAAVELDVPIEKIIESLSLFSGVRRRFELKAKLEKPNITIVDDYGHHPTEIAATISAAKLYVASNDARRLAIVFQPHRYSRTQFCWNQFAESFAGADKVFVLDVYAAGEPPIKGINSRALVDEVKKSGVDAEYIASETKEALIEAARVIRSRLRDADFVITLGAGSVTNVGPLLVSEFQK